MAFWDGDSPRPEKQQSSSEIWQLFISWWQFFPFARIKRPEITKSYKNTPFRISTFLITIWRIAQKVMQKLFRWPKLLRIFFRFLRFLYSTYCACNTFIIVTLFLALSAKTLPHNQGLRNHPLVVRNVRLEQWMHYLTSNTLQWMKPLLGMRNKKEK